MWAIVCDEPSTDLGTGWLFDLVALDLTLHQLLCLRWTIIVVGLNEIRHGHFKQQ